MKRWKKWEKIEDTMFHIKYLKNDNTETSNGMPKQLTFFTIQYKREFTFETGAGHKFLTK